MNSFAPLFRIVVLVNFALVASCCQQVFAQLSPSSNQSAGTHAYYLATLAAAEKSLRLNQIQDAKKWLAATPAAHRHWEWFFLNAQLDESSSAIPTDAQATEIQVSPNGELLAEADSKGSIRIFRLSNSKVVREIDGHTDAVYSIAFSPDGRQLASVSRDTTARVWDVETGDEISRIQLDNPGVAAIAFSPDGNRVATCTWLMEGEPRSVYGVVWIWDAATGEIAHRQLVGIKPLDSIDWSADGKTIAVGSWDGLVHVLDETGQQRRKLKIPDEGIYNAVISVALNQDGTLVAAGSKDRTVRVWNLADGELVRTLRNHNGFVNALAFSPTESTLATGCEDAIVRLWNLDDDPTVFQVLRGHERAVNSLAWSPGGQHLHSAARDQTIRTWDTRRSFGSKLDIAVGVDGTYSATFTPDGKSLYVATYDGDVLILDATTGEKQHSFVAHSSSCNFLALDASGRLLLTCSWDETAKLWSIPDHKLIHTFDAGGGVYHCDLASDGRRAALCIDSLVQIWDTESGMKVGELSGHGKGVRAAAFSPRGNLLATASADKSVGIWNFESGERVATLTGHESAVNAITYTADGQNIISGDELGKVNIWSTSNGRLQDSIQVGDRTIHRLAVSPDGKRIAVGSMGVWIIDPAFGEPILQFVPVPDTVWYLAFSPRGRRLAVCTTGGQISICDASPEFASDASAEMGRRRQ